MNELVDKCKVTTPWYEMTKVNTMSRLSTIMFWGVLQKQLEDLAVQLGSATILLAYAESDKHWQFFFFFNFFFCQMVVSLFCTERPKAQDHKMTQ
jgi:hypothetical protein